jgi:hypothetical protein
MRVSKNQVTLLSAAVAALFAASANAQVVLAPNNTSASTAQGAVKYASEIANNTVIGTAGITVNTILGIGTSINQDRYIKITLTNGTFAAAVVNGNLTGTATVVTPNIAASITPTVSFGGTAGSSSVIFQITTPNGANITDGLSFNMTGGVNIPSTASSVTVTYEVYEFLAQAQAGTPVLYSKAASIATFTPTYVFQNNATPLPTQVATALSGFRNFNFGTAGSAATAANAAVVGKVDLLNSATAGKLVDGTTTATIAVVLANAANSTVTMNGDFSAAAANTAVTLGSVPVVANGGAAFTASQAVFNFNGSAGLVNNAVGYVVNGTTAAPASSYTATLSAAGNAAVYKTTTSGPITTGSITRDGVQFESPWVTATTGFISRFFLLQTSGSPITYTAIVRNAAGLVTGGTLTGSLTSGNLTPVTLASLLPADTTAFPGPYQVTFNIASDASVTQGTYVLTSPNGSVSNMPLYRATQR